MADSVVADSVVADSVVAASIVADSVGGSSRSEMPLPDQEAVVVCRGLTKVFKDFWLRPG